MTRGKIVGLCEIKGTKVDAVMVSAMAPNVARGAGIAVGEDAASVWVDRPMFDKAANGRKFNDLLGKQCMFFYRQNSNFLEAFEIG